MCDCLKKLCEKHSKGYAKNGLDACVRARIRGEVRIVQFIEDRDSYGTKTGKIRHSKSKKYESMPAFKFCPMCGGVLEKPYEELWFDEEGDKI
ncbi:hypothetical protein ABEV00_21995 [Paenibacillus thiaminolyticus]|uniref:hypothetical protein n=1 Tax=Paenibacillus thiaminolyticus TaxID=49283 RepID=UPI003D28388B